MSYALYKHEKDETANGLRESGKTDEEVEEHLRAFHNQVLMSDARLTSYKHQAASLIDIALTQSVRTIEQHFAELEDSLKAEHYAKMNELEKKEKELATERKQFERFKGKVRTEIVNQIKASSQDYKKPSLLVRSGMWLWSGFSGMVASVLVMVITLGLLTLGNPESKHQLVVNFVKSLTSLITGGPVS